MTRSPAQRRAIHAQYGSGGGKTIQRGFKVHRVGKRVRQVGFGATVAGVGGLALTDLAGVFANPHTPAIFPRTSKLGAPVWSALMRSPLAARAIQYSGYAAPHLAKAGVKLRNLASRAKVFPQAAKAADFLQRGVPTFGKMVKYGVPVGVAGAGIAWAGGKIIQHGFRKAKKRQQILSGRKTPFSSWSL